MRFTPKDLINHETYPVSTPGPVRDAILARVRGELESRGCAVLKGFLTPAGIAAAVSEAEGVADKGHRSYSRTNAYFTKDDASLPETDLSSAPRARRARPPSRTRPRSRAE